MPTSLELVDDLLNILGGSSSSSSKSCPFQRTQRRKCPQNKRPKYVDYLALRKELESMISTKGCAPIMVRLAWHDSGSYCKNSNTGGSRACMRFNTGESTYGCNNGLDVARGLVQDIVDKYTQKNFSIADIWTLAGVCAIKVTGGPDVPFRLGRTDASCPEESVPNGRLPDGDKGLSHLREIFGRMGFNDRDIVALSGAHTLGKCSPDRSGFEGPWTSEPLVFDNSYFRDLVNKKWVSSVSSKGQPQLKPFNPKTSPDNTMMLTTDYCLFDELDTREYVLEYARSQDKFFKDFANVFQRLLELGYDDNLLYTVDSLER